jgi:hypothetical protein
VFVKVNHSSLLRQSEGNTCAKRFITLTPGSEKVWASSEGGGIGGGAVAVGLPGLPWGLALTATPRQTRARTTINFMVE